MIQYHPATDYYHCWMRFASILCTNITSGVEFERLRIIDFFLCFPFEINDCQLPRKYGSAISKALNNIPKCYEDQNSVRQAFIQMRSIQWQVAMDMAAKGIVCKEKYRDGWLTPDLVSPSSKLLQTVADEWDSGKQAFHQLMIEALLSLPLNGKAGLKARSHLMEFRYDG